MEEGLLESAKERFLRSSNYFLAAEFLFPPNTQEKLTLAEEARTSFLKACHLSPNGFQPIHIPYENTTLPGYLYLAPHPKPTKTIILNTGYDGTAEELYFHIGFFAQKKGYNVLIFEGPGQGIPLRKDHLTFCSDWEKVMKVVVDFALSNENVDPQRLALYGLSFGGYLAPRATIHEKRIKALIANSPIEDFCLLVEKYGLPTALARKNAKQFDQEMNLEMKSSPKIQALITEGMWKIGGATPSEWVKNLEKYRITSKISQIECPTLVIDSEEDSIIDRTQAQTFYDQLKCPKTLISFPKGTGGALHCQAGSYLNSNEIIFDWLDRQFTFPSHSNAPSGLLVQLPGA